MNGASSKTGNFSLMEEEAERKEESSSEGQADHNDNRASRKGTGEKSGKKRHGARNQNRHKNFVKWIVETFDLKPSNDFNDDSTEDIILDVAGGKGEVSARLCMCHRQRVVMVDPRPADLPHCFETLVYPKIPNKWQRRLDDQRAKNPDFVSETISRRFHQLTTTFDENSLESSQELRNSLENAKLVLGLHADGATEAIVDAALERNKPFCVVPCCVFPNLFRSRRVENEYGEMVPVRSHEQFCRYLAAKDKRLRMKFLPFEGRNLAIYWDGKSTEDI
eukprot:scaffold22589_cov138-Cylindrotheca_fusiformis.AAC.36